MDGHCCALLTWQVCRLADWKQPVALVLPSAGEVEVEMKLGCEEVRMHAWEDAFCSETRGDSIQHTTAYNITEVCRFHITS